MATHTCVVCRQPGDPCTACADEPVFCSSHFIEHRHAVHEQRAGGGRSVDDALAAALLDEGFEPE
jgi:hypothetical protein